MLATRFGTIPSQGGGGTCIDGLDYGKKITVPSAKIDGELSNFPLTVYLNEDNFDFTKCKADGSDIRFTDIELNNLKFERKEHDSVNEIAVYNVQLPTVSDTTDTEIYMWYGNENAYNASMEAWQDMTGKALTYNGNVKLQYDSTLGKRKAVFDGSGDYFEVPNTSSIEFGVENFTIEYWQYKTSYTSAYEATFSLGRSGYSLNVIYNGTGSAGHSILVGNSLGGWAVNISYPKPALNQWHHFSLVRNGDTFTMYIDGVSQGTSTYSGSLGSYANNLTFGGARNSSGAFFGDSWFSGNIGGFRITKGRARYTSTFTPPTPFDIDGDDVVFCTNFDTVYDENYAMVQHMGDSLVDASGNGNNGTATGTTVVSTDYGKVRQFTRASSHKIAIPNIAFSAGSAFTINLLAKLDAIATYGSMPYGYATTTYKSYMFYTNTAFNLTDNTQALMITKPTVQSGSGWEDVTAKTENGVAKLFKDGVSLGTNNFAHAGFNLNSIGQAYNSSYHVNGLIADFRVSTVARSDAWIKAESLALKNDLVVITDL